MMSKGHMYVAPNDKCIYQVKQKCQCYTASTLKICPNLIRTNHSAIYIPSIRYQL